VGTEEFVQVKGNSRRYVWLFGEALIIVLGVLIALAVDRAIQRVDQDAFEMTLIEGLLRDFQGADSVLVEARSWSLLRDEMGRELLAVLEGETSTDLEARSLAAAIEFSPLQYPLVIPRDTWDDLVGTGELGAITNPDVRRAVSRFYRGVEMAELYYDERASLTAPFSSDVRLILPARTRLAMYEALLRGDITLTAVAADEVPPLDELLSRVRGWPNLEGHLSDVLIGTTAGAILFADLRAEVETAIRILEAELDAS